MFGDNLAWNLWIFVIQNWFTSDNNTWNVYFFPNYLLNRNSVPNFNRYFLSFQISINKWLLCAKKWCSSDDAVSFITKSIRHGRNWFGKLEWSWMRNSFWQHTELIHREEVITLFGSDYTAYEMNVKWVGTCEIQCSIIQFHDTNCHVSRLALILNYDINMGYHRQI